MTVSQTAGMNLDLPIMPGTRSETKVLHGRSQCIHRGHDGKHRVTFDLLTDAAKCDFAPDVLAEVTGQLTCWRDIVAHDKPAAVSQARVSPPCLARSDEGDPLFCHQAVAAIATSYINRGAWGFCPGFIAAGATLASIAGELARLDARDQTPATPVVRPGHMIPQTVQPTPAM